MRGTEHAPIATALVVALVACRPETRIVAPAAAPARPPQCVVTDRDVGFPGLALMSTPPAEAMALHPFAELRHADLARLELPAGKPSSVSIDVETRTLRLHGFATASSVVVYPSLPSAFGDLVVPLATNHLEWRDSVGHRVLVLPGHQPGASTSIEPEWRDCSYLRLRPQPRFDLGLRKQSKLALARGAYLVRSSPEAPASKVTLELRGDEEIWVVETRQSWARILWEASDVAIIGWIDRRDGPSPALGHGSGTGEGAAPSTCGPGPIVCDADLPLFATSDRSVLEIGSIKRGASTTFGRVRGDYTEIQICDPDVMLVETVVVKTRDAQQCHRR